ncbi:DUF1835 domain-containing protein [Pseudomonas tructae]|uniref:DUF1835 domain-containing protein n=1 Tax=Pseudomonas tructae TaxID=2518644 RepID=A0A411MHQ6_9PSED|nr:DUF1835 domain-containing protein [Pseudomonas tructae]QBF26337.1 DUF1835 domain-containing protein [Pseudomonas tructae]
MSARLSPPSHDGRINLEQQRKRAKELLQRLRSGAAPEQLARLNTATARLADAQWLIARDLGFTSWPTLKAHVDAIDFAARHPQFVADDEAATQHWRCGNDISHSLRLAGFTGAFHMLSDPLVMGPVRDVPAAPYRALRCDYISQAYGLEYAEVQRKMADEYAALTGLDGCHSAVLWCEADAYDQLFLIRLLATLDNPPQRLELIEIDRMPGVERFIGIGQLAPEVLAWLWPQRRAVDAPMLQLAREAWAAYCAPSPQAWAQLAHRQDLALPLLGAALLRQLQELPGVDDGLSLSERLALQIISESGQLPFGRVFVELMGKHEPLPYLGDLMFHALLRPLIDAPTPLIHEAHAELEWPHRPLRLTPLGEQVLAGRAYWLDQQAPERWVGGVRLNARQAHWALDHSLWPVWRQ